MARVEPFEKYTQRYEDWFEAHPYVYESEIKAIQSLLLPVKESVEIGVGSGRFAIPLGIKYGLEPSTRMMEIAQKRGIKVVAGIAENLPFVEARFDLVLMVTTICFLDDLENITEVEPVKSGYGEGSFVVIRAQKQ